jgi:hypothetical protein
MKAKQLPTASDSRRIKAAVFELQLAISNQKLAIPNQKPPSAECC